MKVMIVTGGIDSIWTKEFIGKVLDPLGCEIFIQKSPMDSDKFLNYYEKLGVNFVFPYKVIKALMRIPGIRKWYGYSKRYKVLDNTLELDYIICIFGNPFYLKCAEKLATSRTKIITWFIGSDLLRAKKTTLNELSIRMDRVDSQAVCVTEKISNAYRKQMNGKSADAVIDFGNSQIEEIERIASSSDNQKQVFLKISKEYTTIAIGYNGSPAQQHFEVINSIIKMQGINFSQLCLVLPMTYQKNRKYTNAVRDKLNASGIKYIILEDFLDSEGMARLWNSVDIFIHAQTSDAFSASMLESLYAGCEVFNGSWLNYKELDDWNIRYNSFENFEVLTEMLSEKLKVGIRKCSQNRENIKQYFSWDVCREKWERILSHI